MKKILLICLLSFSCSGLFSQASKASLNDPDIKTKLQKIKDNIDHLFQTFKGAKEPDLGLGLGDSYSTTIKFYNVKGSLDNNDYDENMSFRISTNEYKKATKADFEKAYATLADNLKAVFDFLEQREKESDGMKELSLFEKGKNTEAAVRDPDSPKYYINVKLTEEKNEASTGYSIFLFFTTKK